MTHKSLLTIFFALVALFLLTGCHGHKDEPEPVSKRTVLVYMVANNTLGAWHYDDEDLTEMQKAVAAGHLGNQGRLLAYHAGRNDEPALIEITPQGPKQIKTYSDEVYSTDPERLKEILADMKKTAPAEGYGLVFWSHADGWLDGARPSDNRYKSFGDDRGTYMRLSSLADALNGQRFDFLYFDCCLMGNIETLWALRDAAPVIIASPTELSVHGMPYHQTLRHLFLDEPDYAAAARTTFEWYDKNEDFNNRDCQISVVRTDALPALARASRRILSALEAYPGRMPELQSMSVPGKTRYHVDMGDYYRRIADLAGVPTLYDEWKATLDDAVVAAYTTEFGIGSLLINTYSGLATFPIGSADDLATRGYNTSAWYRDVLADVPLYSAK